jgi:hypothetical protein
MEKKNMSAKPIRVALPVEAHGQIPYHRDQVSDNREPAALVCGRIIPFVARTLTAKHALGMKQET